MAIPQEELKTLIQTDSPNTKKETDSLEAITSSQKNLLQLKESMDTLLNSIIANPSWITQLSTTWADYSTVQRILLGGAIVIPTLVGGMAMHASVLFTLTGVSMAGLTFGGVVLDEHYEKHTANIGKIKEGVFSFINLLDGTITALENIRYKFSNEIEKLRIQNEELHDSIIQLKSQLGTLPGQLEALMATKDELDKEVAKLEQRNQELSTRTEQNSQLLITSQLELAKVKKEFEINQLHLSDKIIELSNVRTALEAETEKTKKIATTLSNTIKSLANSGINGAKAPQSFQEQLNNAFTQKEADLSNIVDRMAKAATEIRNQAQTILNATNHNQENRPEQLDKIQELEQKVIAEQTTKPNSSFARLQAERGFFGFKHINPPTPNTMTPILAM